MSAGIKPILLSEIQSLRIDTDCNEGIAYGVPVCFHYAEVIFKDGRFVEGDGLGPQAIAVLIRELSPEQIIFGEKGAKDKAMKHFDKYIRVVPYGYVGFPRFPSAPSIEAIFARLHDHLRSKVLQEHPPTTKSLPI